jgi:hypothetical protein
MYFDTSFNTVSTALANLYRIFNDAAQRADHYMRSMPKHNQPSFETVKSKFLVFSTLLLTAPVPSGVRALLAVSRRSTTQEGEKKKRR